MDQVRDTPIKAERGSRDTAGKVLCGLRILSGGLLLQGFNKSIGALAFSSISGARFPSR